VIFCAGEPERPRACAWPKSEQRRLLDLPAADEEPEHEEDFGEEGDEDEAKICVGEEVGLDAVDGPAESVDEEEDAQDPRDVAGAKDQVAEQREVNSEEDERERPSGMKGVELQPDLRLQLRGAEDGQVIRSGQELIDVYEAEDGGDRDAGVDQLEDGSEQGQGSVDGSEQDVERPGEDDVADEADEVAKNCCSEKVRVSGDVLRGLLGVACGDQLWVDGELGVADGIEEIGEAGDECGLAQSHSVVVSCCRHRSCGSRLE